MSESNAAEPHDPSEQRRYIRIPSLIPVDFQFVSTHEGPLDSTVRTGITRDLSHTGLCLNIAALPSRIAKRLEARDLSDLTVTMDIAMPRRTLRLTGRVAWASAIISASGKRFRAGIEFQQLSDGDAEAIISFARRAALWPRVVRGVMAGLAAAACFAMFAYWWSAQEHRAQMTVAQARIAEANTRYRGVTQELEALTQDLLSLSADLRAVEQQDAAADVGETDTYEPEVIASAVVELRADLSMMRERLQELRQAGTDTAIAKAESDPKDAAEVDEAAPGPGLPDGVSATAGEQPQADVHVPPSPQP